VTSVNNVVIWIVTALWGGYTASNVLKWYWWRFNGYGYFWGMVAGISSALTIPALITSIQPLQNFAHAHSLNLEVSVGFGVVFLLSLIGCFLGTYLTAPEDDAVLKEFYRRVRPWGFWGPILKKVQQEDSSFQKNKDFFRDMFNVVVGITWQISLVALPIYIVTWRLRTAAITLGVIAITSIILKFTWYNHLKELEHINQYSEPANAAPETTPVAN
jgi:SSS family solute:Na+ symporter